MTAGSLVIAFLLVLAATPLVRRFAIRIKALDKPGERKVHQDVMPRLGGLAICMGFWATVLLTQDMTRQVYGLLAGGLIVCAVGVWDDLRGVSPRVKLLFQIIAASVALSLGIRVEFMTNPVEGVVFLGYLSYPVTVLWLTGMTNAVNLIDGLDGLAAGVSAIAAITLGIVSILEGGGVNQAALLAFILAASIFGFIKYNFYPARIFMGDTGSLFLGFNLAALAILSLTKISTVISLFLPVVILGIPIIDTLFAIVRRYHNKKPIFSPDKEHLHHQLLALGLSHRRTVLTIYGLSIVLGLTAILMSVVTTAQGMMIMVVVTLGVFFAGDRIGVLRKARLEQQAAKSAKNKKAYQHAAK